MIATLEQVTKDKFQFGAIFYLLIILRLQRMSALFQTAGQTMKREEPNECYAIHMMAQLGSTLI